MNLILNECYIITIRLLAFCDHIEQVLLSQKFRESLKYSLLIWQLLSLPRNSPTVVEDEI
jgi:hypothetical protein